MCVYMCVNVCDAKKLILLSKHVMEHRKLLSIELNCFHYNWQPKMKSSCQTDVVQRTERGVLCVCVWGGLAEKPLHLPRQSVELQLQMC